MYVQCNPVSCQAIHIVKKESNRVCCFGGCHFSFILKCKACQMGDRPFAHTERKTEIVFEIVGRSTLTTLFWLSEQIRFAQERAQNHGLTLTTGEMKHAACQSFVNHLRHFQTFLCRTNTCFTLSKIET